ncbi:endonuclease/exonuclease/phosphatase family protein [Yoonia sediminilitoris]|uniref:Endonuclease/exonuclease/phosphatase family protein n=1 Tax=Yoonia sediminilitoris TaxID=1286148 RepID=A0A2T6KB92_9RHOB|nr:endonuclease/exonuclease/phosphatase family protein [Yoonia sediminilitoris]PUB12139.1 endonuclease/exonuclease/phosphatase family protein [Yoonia sediminilitoris]RCW92966.1 endonuclease/exonuclease/phosphatase family protein [Yoonia sediminilitoris]
MTRFTIASFNVKNLIEADQEYYRFEEYTPEEYAWKRAWLADQLLTMNADIVCFQEIFSEASLRDLVIETDELGQAANDAVIPDRSKRYARKAIFRKLAFEPYTEAALAFAPNLLDGGPGQRRPGVAILSRFGFAGAPEIIQDLPEPLDIPFSDLDGSDGGHYRIKRLSRPVLKVKIPVGDTIVTVFNCHLKSKLGELPRPEGAPFPPAADLVNYDPAARAMGSLRAGLRRMAEAWVLRRAILSELETGHPVMVLGDFNDSEHAVSSEIIKGETPFKNYAWMRRHDAQTKRDRYSDAENEVIQEAIGKVLLYSAEKLFVRKSLRDMVYTSAFGGVFESIDQILLSRHFHPDSPDRIGEMEYFSVLNDHLTDGSHPEAPYNKLASDHGQIMAHMVLGTAAP